MIGEVLWEATLDNHFRCEVRRLSEYRGHLTVHDGEALLHEQDVGLSYGAIFGPDVDDVQDWQIICEGVIDEKGKADGQP